jgi:hypothetical protein
MCGDRLCIENLELYGYEIIILGAAALRNFYTVLDQTTTRVGMRQNYHYPISKHNIP